MDQDTIEGVVERQIANPRNPVTGDPDYDQVFMPADIVTGTDAEDVAAYVASVAGVPGIEPPPLGNASELFTEKCGGCHTLEAAASAGVTGPVLDDVLPQRSPDDIHQSIREPQAEISPGFEGAVMPVFDENQIPEPNLNALIAYLVACAGDASSTECEQAGEQEQASALPGASGGSSKGAEPSGSDGSGSSGGGQSG
jgi:mono/diheme cytochrome c family protein